MTWNWDILSDFINFFHHSLYILDIGCYDIIDENIDRKKVDISMLWLIDKWNSI